jgi:hypothetical protein
VTSLYAGTVSILLGNGDGTFQPAVSYYAGGHATSVALGDFNGDGKTDLVVSTAVLAGNNEAVAVLLGNGDGTFQAAVYYPAANVPQFVAVGDFNGDGRRDLAVTGLGGVSILLGDGTGAFAAPVFYATGDGFAAQVAVGDFDGDGKADLAVAGGLATNTAAILLGNGDGTFQAAVSYVVGAGPVAVAIHDFNRDGKAGLAVAGSGNLSILPGNGDGTFQPPVNFTVGSYPVSMVAGHFNADGKPDLAVASFPNIVSILTNTTP